MGQIKRYLDSIFIGLGVLGLALTGLSIWQLSATGYADTLAFLIVNLTQVFLSIPIPGGPNISGTVITSTAGLFVLPPWGAYLALVPSSIVESRIARRPWHITLANVALVAGPHWLGATFFRWLMRGTPRHSIGEGINVLLALFVTYAINYLAIAVLVGLREGKPPMAILEQMLGRSGLVVFGIRLQALLLAVAYEAAGFIALAISAVSLWPWRAVVSFYFESEALRRAAHLDGLTQVGNRRAWEAALGKLQPGSHIFVVDLDDLKKLNDRYGHAKGDKALRDIAEALQRGVGKRGEVFRLGGDEFAVISRVDLFAALEAELARLSERWRADGMELSASIGCAVCGPDDNPQAIFNLADQRMYEIKRAKEVAST